MYFDVAISMLLELLPFNMMPFQMKKKKKKKNIFSIFALYAPFYSVEEDAGSANCHIQDVKTLLPN